MYVLLNKAWNGVCFWDIPLYIFVLWELYIFVSGGGGGGGAAKSGERIGDF